MKSDRLKALVLTCSLSPSPTPSSSDVIARQIMDELSLYDVDSTLIRAVDRDIKPGVKTDMGDGDAWPEIREQMLESEILIMATPIWLGHPSSISHQILERLDAELSETDEEGRLMTYGKVAAVAVVGNEDGAHHVHAELFQGLNDVGFTIPAACGVYWVGEAMQKVDYKDLKETPKAVAASIKSMALNTAHLARLLKNSTYPAIG